MTLSDWIGFFGVSLLLIAFLLNLLKKITTNSLPYCFLNFIGASFACLASVLLMYWPFIILESVWTLVSLAAIVKSLRENPSNSDVKSSENL